MTAGSTYTQARTALVLEKLFLQHTVPSALQNPPCDSPTATGWATYMEYGSLRSMCGITR
jgi:hypothetical protein